MRTNRKQIWILSRRRAKTTEINKLNVVNEIFWLWQCSSQTIAEEAFERTSKFYWDRKLCYLYSDCFAKFSTISKLLNASWINKHRLKESWHQKYFSSLHLSRHSKFPKQIESNSLICFNWVKRSWNDAKLEFYLKVIKRKNISQPDYLDNCQLHWNWNVRPAMSNF